MAGLRKLAAQQRLKKYADEKRLDVHYAVGDMVWLNSQHVSIKAVGTRKMLPHWLGPFEVLEKPGPVNYTLDIPAHYRIHRTFDVSMLRRLTIMVLVYSGPLSS